MRRYVGHVCRNIGGIYHEYKSVEQPGAVYQVEEKVRQKKALQWLDKNVLTRPDWLIAEDYVLRLNQRPEALIQQLAETTVGTLCAATTLNRIAMYSYEKGSYQPEEYVDDLVHLLFRETQTGAKVCTWRAYIQQQAVVQLVKAWGLLKGEVSHPLAMMAINKIKTRVSNAHPTDSFTKAHYADLAQQIKMALEGNTSEAKSTNGRE